MRHVARPFVLVSVVSLQLGGVLIAGAPAQVAPPAAGRIVYVSIPQGAAGNQDVFVMNADGSDKTNITNTSDLNESGPVWHPEGNRIAFARSLPVDDVGTLQSDIFVMDADGSNATNLTDTPNRSEIQPTWSPTGDRIAFAREVAGNPVNNDIFVLELAGDQAATNITESPYEEFNPSWSPVGERIAFNGVRDVPTTPEVDNDWEIVTVLSDGTGEQVLTGEDRGQHEDWAPDWSPDGEMVVYMSQRDAPCCGDWDIWAVNADGTGVSNLTPGDGDSSFDTADWFPAWATDGSGITFERSSEQPGRFDIWVMPAPESLPTGGGAAGGAATASRFFANASRAGAQDEARRLTFDGNSKTPDWYVDVVRCTIRGSRKAEVLEGTAGDDVICGRGGDDVIRAGEGRDVVRAGRGGDTVRGGAGRDRLLSERGADHVFGGPGGDGLRGGLGDDVLDTRDGIDGNDRARGGADGDLCRVDDGDVATSCRLR